jgi:hypothetical protein
MSDCGGGGDHGGCDPGYTLAVFQGAQDDWDDGDGPSSSSDWFEIAAMASLVLAGAAYLALWFWLWHVVGAWTMLIILPATFLAFAFASASA